MTTPSDSIAEFFLGLPWSERRHALEELVVAEFKAVLLMTAEDELPFDQSYFDLGLTSLTITDLKQRLEGMLGSELNSNVLFNSPTVGRLLDHVTEEILAEMFRIPATAKNLEG
jgi:acyl carrier protein